MGEASLSKGQPGLSWASDTLGPLSGESERPEEKLPPPLPGRGGPQREAPGRKAADGRTHTTLSPHTTWKNLPGRANGGVKW